MEPTSDAAVVAEATGQPHITATYRGHDFKLPTDLDDWPLHRIAYTVGIGGDKLCVDHTTTANALMTLLGGQWQTFLAEFPKRRHLAAASQAFAHAAGVGAEGDYDIAFGALPRLLATLTSWPEAVEATLAEMGVDYRDRWRFDTDHRRLLTLRQIHVRLCYAQPDSPLAVAQNHGRRPHNGTEILLMDLFEAITKHAHPSRPMSDTQKATRTAQTDKLEAERAKYRERHNPAKQRKLSAVETARANAKGNTA